MVFHFRSSDDMTPSRRLAEAGSYIFHSGSCSMEVKDMGIHVALLTLLDLTRRYYKGYNPGTIHRGVWAPQTGDGIPLVLHPRPFLHEA